MPFYRAVERFETGRYLAVGNRTFLLCLDDGYLAVRIISSAQPG
jgi:hypothetical protein